MEHVMPIGICYIGVTGYNGDYPPRMRAFKTLDEAIAFATAGSVLEVSVEGSEHLPGHIIRQRVVWSSDPQEVTG
jgi:hypothetical protein